MILLRVSLTSDSCLTPLLEAKTKPEAIRREGTTDAAQNDFFINAPLVSGVPENRIDKIL